VKRTRKLKVSYPVWPQFSRQPGQNKAEVATLTLHGYIRELSVTLLHSARDLSKHLEAVRVHDSNATKGSALLEGLDEKGLGGFKLDLCILILGELWGILNLGATSLLAHLPQDLGHLARNLGRPAENDRGVAWLEDTWVLLHSNNSREGLDGLEVAVFLDVDDVTRRNLLVLANAFDGEANGVTWAGFLKLLLVLLDGEDLLVLEAGGDDANNVARHEGSLLNSTADDLPNTLDVVDVGDRKTDGKLRMTLGWLDEIVKGINNSESSDLELGFDVGGPALVPGSLV